MHFASLLLLASAVGVATPDSTLRTRPAPRTIPELTAAIERLLDSTRPVLTTWTAKLLEENGDAFPNKVTAFRPGMAVHGRYRQPCPRCGAPVQRIVYARSEANYCAACQTGGRLLADRALSRLLRQDWPKTLDEAEAGRSRLR